MGKTFRLQQFQCRTRYFFRCAVILQQFRFNQSACHNVGQPDVGNLHHLFRNPEAYRRSFVQNFTAQSAQCSFQRNRTAGGNGKIRCAHDIVRMPFGQFDIQTGLFNGPFQRIPGYGYSPRHGKIDVLAFLLQNLCRRQHVRQQPLYLHGPAAGHQQDERMSVPFSRQTFRFFTGQGRPDRIHQRMAYEFDVRPIGFI